MLQFLSSIFSREVMGSKTVALAFIALLIALLLAVIAYVILTLAGVQYGSSGASGAVGPLAMPLRILILALLLFSFVIVWFLLYTQYNREAEDIYSRLREKLVGTWQVQYELYPGQNRIDLKRPGPVVCNILVNDATKKLELQFTNADDPLFVDTKQIIQGIALRHEADNRYTMSYHYKRTNALGPLISAHLLSEDGDSAQSELVVEIFATLAFEDAAPGSKIQELKGQWFDLNGNLIRFFSIVSEVDEHADDRELFKKKLSNATITRDNFAALMGEIKFTRVKDA